MLGEKGGKAGEKKPFPDHFLASLALYIGTHSLVMGTGREPGPASQQS